MPQLRGQRLDLCRPLSFLRVFPIGPSHRQFSLRLVESRLFRRAIQGVQAIARPHLLAAADGERLQGARCRRGHVYEFPLNVSLNTFLFRGVATGQRAQGQQQASHAYAEPKWYKRARGNRMALSSLFSTPSSTTERIVLTPRRGVRSNSCSLDGFTIARKAARRISMIRCEGRSLRTAPSRCPLSEDFADVPLNHFLPVAVHRLEQFGILPLHVPQERRLDLVDVLMDTCQQPLQGPGKAALGFAGNRG